MPASSPACVIAPQMASISVGAPRRKSWSIEEIFDDVFLAISSAANAGLTKESEMFFSIATDAVSRASSPINAFASGIFSKSPLGISKSAVSGLIAALITNLLQIKDWTFGTLWTLKLASVKRALIAPNVDAFPPIPNLLPQLEQRPLLLAMRPLL